jgi:hypothetical protein
MGQHVQQPRVRRAEQKGGDVPNGVADVQAEIGGFGHNSIGEDVGCSSGTPLFTSSPSAPAHG